MTARTLYMALGVLALIAIVSLSAILSPRQPHSRDVTLPIAVTLSPLQDLVQQIGQDHVRVSLILPPGASPHTFEPTPQQVVELSNTQTVFAIGHGIDSWITPMVAATGASVTTLDQHVDLLCGDEYAEEHEHEQTEADSDLIPCDPHYWLDPRNMAGMARQVAEHLSELDPAHASDFQQAADAYVDQLDQVSVEVRKTLAEAPSKDLIVFHDSWRYYARAFDLDIRGMFEPSPGQEPSARDLAELSRITSIYAVPRVYIEPQLSPAQIQSFVSDLHLRLGILDPIGGLPGRLSYKDLLLFNAHAIAEPLN